MGVLVRQQRIARESKLIFGRFLIRRSYTKNAFPIIGRCIFVYVSGLPVLVYFNYEVLANAPELTRINDK